MKALFVAAALAGSFAVPNFATARESFRANFASPEVGASNAASPSSRSVVAEASRFVGQRNMTGKPGPWCASFASYILQRTGHAPLASGVVSSAFQYGPRLPEPKVGALAVVSTRYGYAGHLGFVAGVNSDGSIRLISGNWGHRVADANIARRSVVAFVQVD